MSTDFNMQPAGASVDANETTYHAVTSMIACQAVGNRTIMVNRQLPDEAVLHRRAYFHAIGLSKGAPHRVCATERIA